MYNKKFYFKSKIFLKKLLYFFDSNAIINKNGSQGGVMMNFGLEDIRNNTILGTPIQELAPLVEELKKDLQSNAEKQKKA